MPKIDMSLYNEASSGGEYAKMGAGGYICKILSIKTDGTDWGGRRVDYVNDKQYVKVLWDVCEGEFSGKFSDSFFADKDYAHQLFLSWKNMGAFKGSIEALEASNLGWDVMADFERDNWKAFEGKLFGAVIGEEEYIGNDGSVKTRLGLPKMRSVWDIRDGKFKVPELKRLPDDQRPKQVGASMPVGDDDIPF